MFYRVGAGEGLFEEEIEQNFLDCVFKTSNVPEVVNNQVINFNPLFAYYTCASLAIDGNGALTGSGKLWAVEGGATISIGYDSRVPILHSEGLFKYNIINVEKITEFHNDTGIFIETQADFHYNSSANAIAIAQPLPTVNCLWYYPLTTDGSEFSGGASLEEGRLANYLNDGGVGYLETNGEKGGVAILNGIGYNSIIRRTVTMYVRCPASSLPLNTFGIFMGLDMSDLTSTTEYWYIPNNSTTKLYHWNGSGGNNSWDTAQDFKSDTWYFVAIYVWLYNRKFSFWTEDVKEIDDYYGNMITGATDLHFGGTTGRITGGITPATMEFSQIRVFDDKLTDSEYATIRASTFPPNGQP